MFDNVSQSNARFNATDTLIVMVHSVTMPVGFGGDGMKRKGRPLATMAHLKRSNVKVRAEENCLAHALVIAIAWLNNDTIYTSYRKGDKIRPMVRQLLETTGIDLKNGGGIPELTRFQDNFTNIRSCCFRERIVRVSCTKAMPSPTNVLISYLTM